MGTGASRENQLSSAERHSREIDKLLDKDKMSQSNNIKLLLLGASGSGKSTLAKQMRMLYEYGFALEDRLAFRPIIYGNLRDLMQTILNNMEKNNKSENENWTLESRSFFTWYASTMDEGVEAGLSVEVADAIKRFWFDPAFRQSFSDMPHTQEFVSAPYFFDAIDRLADELYVPTDQDILRAREENSSVTETKFHFKEYTVSLCDVGEQRTEKRKWIHCFDNVTAILFTVAMGHYDQTLDEGDKTNRLEESLGLFEWVIGHECFKETPVIVFLNHKDILEQKIRKSSFAAHFVNFTGHEIYENVSQFIKKLFEQIAEKNNREIYSHFTSAINTHETESVLQECMKLILKSHIEETKVW